MWSIRVLKDEAVPVGHSASCTHPRAHLVLRKLQQNAAINKSPSGFCLEDPIVTALTTAACVPCKSTERLCYSFLLEVCAAWVSFFCLYFYIYFLPLDFSQIYYLKKTSNKRRKIFMIGAQLHVFTCVQLAFSLSPSHCCLNCVMSFWEQILLSDLFSLSPYVFLSVSREDLKYNRWFTRGCPP